MRKIITFDLDGVICKEVCWTEEEVRNATPNKKIIEYVNSWYDKSITFIYTARKDDLMSETFKWLSKNGVRYWGLNNRKLPANVYIDDHAVKF